MLFITNLYFTICACITYITLYFVKQQTVTNLVFPTKRSDYDIVNVKKWVLGNKSNKSLILHIDKTNDQPAIGYWLFGLMSKIPYFRSDTRWDNYQQAKQFVDGYSQYLTPFCRYYDYDRFADDKELLNMVVERGVAANLLTYDSTTNTYFVDTMFLGSYQVREPYIKYGAKATFNNKLEIISITTVHHGKTFYYQQAHNSEVHRDCRIYDDVNDDINNDINNDVNDYKKLWAEAVNIFISSSCVYSYVVIHTLHCHLSTIGGISGAVNETFNIDHRMYKLLWPILHKMMYITSGNVISYSKAGGIINRLFAFTTQGYCDLMDNHVDKFRLLQFDTLVEQQGMHNEYSRNSLIYWDTIKEFVTQATSVLAISDEDQNAFVFNCHKYLYNLEQTLQQYNLNEKFIRILTSFIFNATVWHKQVEITLDNFIDPRMLKTKINKNHICQLVDDKLNTEEKMIILLFTNVLMRRLMTLSDDYSSLYRSDNHDNHYTDDDCANLWHTFTTTLNKRLQQTQFTCLLPQNVRIL